MELKYMTEKEVNSLLDMKTCIGLMNNVFTAFAEGKMENKLRSVFPVDAAGVHTQKDSGTVTTGQGQRVDLQGIQHAFREALLIVAADGVLDPQHGSCVNTGKSGL